MKVNLWTTNSYRLWLTNWPKTFKTPEDLSQFDRLLKKLSVEAALNAEMTHHLGYEKNQSRPGANSRNGYSTNRITGDGPLELRTPRDRDDTFEPQRVKKNQPLP
ncbi:transposase [Escherichia coli]